jgi:hypothetical protein
LSKVLSKTHRRTHTCLHVQVCVCVCVFSEEYAYVLLLYVVKNELCLYEVDILILLSDVLQAKFTVISDGPDSNIIECEGIGLKNSA